jgi:hypothetical protein
LMLFFAIIMILAKILQTSCHRAPLTAG